MTDEAEDKDKEWRETLSPELRPIAERYGQELFVVAYNIGAVNESLSVLRRRTAGNREMTRCFTYLVNGFNAIAYLALTKSNITMEQIAEVQRDIQHAAALASVSAKNPAGIILPGR